MTTQTKRPHVVIIGGGFAGLNAARSLARAPVDITLIDRRNHHLFQPLLYQVATAALNPADIAYPIRAAVRRQKNIRVLLAEAKRIDTLRKVVVLDHGEAVYDYLILATGATHSYFGNDGWARHAPGLKSLEDAVEIRRRVLLAYEAAEREPDPERRKAWLTFVVVGAGPTGVEMAGALSEIARHAMIGISFREVYSVDPDTAEATLLATLDRAFNGLSFVPRGQGETLVGTALDGTVWEVNPETGVTTELGAFGNDIGSSGDVVGVFDLGTLATARRDDWSSDHLVRVDPQTGVATDIAELGVTNVWGLGFWNDRLFGFAETGEFIVIDAVTGETELVENTGIAWWGAAVTTDAPVIVELR